MDEDFDLDTEIELTLRQLRSLNGKLDYSENGRSVNVSASRKSLMEYLDYLYKLGYVDNDGSPVEYYGVATP